jgi:kinetochore protein Mis13/DSN1
MSGTLSVKTTLCDILIGWSSGCLVASFVTYCTARCKRESDAWTSVIQLYNARQASTLDALSRQRHQSGTSIEWIPPDTSDPLYERELQGAQLARRCKEIASRKRAQSPLSLRLAEVESKVDRAHSALHISQQLTHRTTRHLDKRFEALAGALAARSRSTAQPSEVSTIASLVSARVDPGSATGMGAPPDTLDILRALARTDVEQPRREVGEAARRAARDVQRASAAGTPGRGVSAGAGAAIGERRLTAVTPRAAPATPRRPGTPRQKSEGVGGGNNGNES